MTSFSQKLHPVQGKFYQVALCALKMNLETTSSQHLLMNFSMVEPTILAEQCASFSGNLTHELQ